MSQFLIPDYILFFIGVLNFILSIFIVSNNYKNKINQSFGIFAFFISFWPFTLLFFRNVSLPYAELWMRMSYIAAAGIALSFWFFTHYFPTERKRTFLNRTLPLILTMILVGLFLKPGFLIKDVIELADGSRTVISEWLGHILYSFYFVGLFFSAIGFLRLNFHNTQGPIKQQSRILFYGVLFSGVFGVLFNLILPSPVFQNFSYIYIGPLFTFVFILAVSYAVAKHQLMNIRALATEFFVVVLFLLSLVQLILVRSWSEFILRTIFSSLIVLFGGLLINNVIQEVRRREQITNLAHSLEQANLQLKELDRQKTEFLSIATHQLRTPLSIIKGYISLIAEGAYGQPTKKMSQILDNIDKSNEHLVKLIDEFLNITRIEQGRTKYNFALTNLNDIVGEVAIELGEKIKEKKLKLSWQPNKQVKNIEVDGEKIRHVIFNFIDNAIKYTNKGEIKINLEKDAKGLIFTVHDHGLGFSEIDQVNFFQKFYRGQNVKETNVTGTGLGLFVCRKFVEAHNGRVWAKSPGLHKGSEFGFWIPRK